MGEPQSQQVAIVKKEDDTDNDEASKSKKRSEPDEQLRPVTWTELDRLRQDCNRLLAIFAEHVADVAGTDRKANPIVYMHGVTNAVSNQPRNSFHFTENVIDLSLLNLHSPPPQGDANCISYSACKENNGRSE